MAIQIIPKRIQVRILSSICVLMMLNCLHVTAQEMTGNAQMIIDLIRQLESSKDPKCYATANRLEDFIYGTPLSDGARNLRNDIQKEIIYFIKTKGHTRATAEGTDSIMLSHIKPVIESISTFGKLKNGDWFYKVDTSFILIKEVDLRQYSSVAYSFRSLVSVEQDLTLFQNANVKHFARECIVPLYNYLNLTTLATLKISDILARQNNMKVISRSLLGESWIKILETSLDEGFKNVKYPSPPSTEKSTDYTIIKKIIDQKVAAYENYNALSGKLFLRNIQVFFARQKWPVDSLVNNELKNYYLESLIDFSSSLIERAAFSARLNNHAFIRIDDVQNALKVFMPFEVNLFEDVTFFPLLRDQSITIESYDLDSFRDSGLHWYILKYSLEDLQGKNIISLDPVSAELVVEGIAQLGVLSLRLAGEYSKKQNKSHLTVEDLVQGFQKIQDLIDAYGKIESEIPPDGEKEIVHSHKSQTTSFEDCTVSSGISFYHKSSDWLNRLIRSYVFAEEENTAKMAIPPAFGGSGVGAEDIDNDGDIDILLLGGMGNQLYINDGNGNYTLSPLSEKLSVWNEALNSYGEPRQPIIADFDNDGWQDIFISYAGDGHKLYRNIEGSDFQDVSEDAALGGENQVGGPATALDYNRDGLLDIFIGYFGNYLNGKLPTLSRRNQNGEANVLLRNKGQFKFEQVAFTPEDVKTGWTQAAGHTDLNNDGFQDIIAGNDFGTNEYYINNGDGTFREISKELKTDKPSYTMNVGIVDINRDQLPDLYISNIVVMQKDEKYISPNEETTMKFNPEKMKNIRTVEANDLFISESGHSGVTYALSEKVGRGYSSTGWSWDADFFDFDNDGDEDLYCLNGMNDFRVYSTENPFYYAEADKSKNIQYAESDREKNILFVNQNGQLIAEDHGLEINSNSRSAAFFDKDNDGDLDVVVNNYHEGANLFCNIRDEETNWMKIKLIGNPGDGITKDAIGAKVIVNSQNHKNIWREIHTTDGYLSVHPKIQHVGLGTDTHADIMIIWPDKSTNVFRQIESNKTYQLQMGSKVLEVLD